MSNEMIRLIEDTPEGKVVALITTPEFDIAATTLSFDKFCSMTSDPSRYFIVTTSLRTGWPYFNRHLELVHFPPMNPKNILMVIFHFKWKGIPFSCISVPKQFHADVLDSAKATNMKLVMGAVPTTVDETGFVPMPIDANNCITVENGEGHIVYENSAQAAEWENKRIQELEAAYL